MAIRVATIATP